MNGNKRTNKQVSAQEAFYQSVIDGVADPIMVIDNQYRIILMNRAAQRFAVDQKPTSSPLYCYQLSHCLSAPCHDDPRTCPLLEVRKKRQPVSVIHEHRKSNEQGRVIEVNAAPLTSPDGTFLGIIESMRDVTARHERELELQRYTNRLRALSSQLAEVSETERRRLSQELHDQVGQKLTALGINLNIIRTQLAGGAPAPLLTRLDDSLALLEQITERIRDVMADLRPPLLDEYGLIAALKWYGERFNRRTNITVQIACDEPSLRLAPRLENVFFHIAQEAMTNAAKHARANQITITLQEEAALIKLIIADDGRGFNPTILIDNEANQGWGIMTMIERAEAEGGHCRVESTPGVGTRVTAELCR